MFLQMAEGRSLREDLTDTVNDLEVLLKQVAENVVAGGGKEQRAAGGGGIAELIRLFRDKQTELDERLKLGEIFIIIIICNCV